MNRELELRRNRLKLETEKELEFSSVLDEISKLCNSEKASYNAELIKPFSNADELRYELDLIEDVSKIFQVNEELPLSGLKEIDSALKKSQIRNAVLDTNELLKIRDNLRIFRLVNNFISNKSEELINLSKLNDVIHYNQFIEKHIDE